MATFDETSSGGIVSSGSAVYRIVSRLTASGGTITGGSSSVSSITIRTSSGGLTAGGTSTFRIRSFRTGSGGVTVGGLSSVVIGFIASGGVTVDGIGRQTFYDYVTTSGGVVVGGDGNDSQQRFYSTESVGGIVITGSADSGISSRSFNVTGGISMGGSAVHNMKFYLDTTFLWNVNSRIVSDTTFLWNTGLLIKYWYRIIGRDRCSNDPCCQRYIMNVHARSPSELCGKLVNRKYKFRIESVQRFLKPADNVNVAALEAEGQDFDCNEFIPIDLCQIPLCEDFCVSYDLEENMSFDIIFNQVNANLDYEASDGVYITGAAETSYTVILPGFSYEAEGGISLGGEAPNQSSGYSCVASGGIVMSGNSYLQSSSWNFVGGVWPNTTRIRTGEETESLAELETDQIWSLTERVIQDDSLFTSTDISYGRTSQYLIVRGFNIDIPDDSNILHVYVTVGRKTNQLSVKDLGAYLINGDEIISVNKAKTISWPYLIESQTIYDFTDSFDVEDINSTEFGFALRVKAHTSVASTIAYVDNIKVEVIYEDVVNQKLRISGTAGVVSSGYTWVASGGIELGGDGKYKQGFKYKPRGTGITIGGRYELNLSYESSGEITIGGSAISRPSFQEIDTSGGVSVGGSAIVKPYLEYGMGGLNVSGDSIVKTIFRTRGSGGIVVGGSVASPSNGIYGVVADGGITMAGVAGRRTESWTYHASGNIAFIFGEADYRSSNFGDFIEDFEFDMSVDDMLVQFDSDKDLHNAKGVVDMLSRCGCGSIPMTLNLEHRIAKDNIFAKFLVRNRLTISNRLTMQYNVPNDSWQTNLHYTGLSSDTNTYESWDIVFDIQCTQNLGGIFIGRQIWKLGMEVTRRNETTGATFATRALIGVMPDKICAANELKFKATMDTQSRVTEITPAATIYQSVLYDDIGMFKNKAWTLSPNLIFTVSQAGLEVIQNRIDLTSDVLVS